MVQKLINTVNRAKPVLKKVLPAGLLRRGKAVIVRHTQRQMAKKPKIPCDPKAFPFGINLIGPIDAATGLGQSFRLVIGEVEETGTPYVIIPFAGTTYYKEDISAYEHKVTDGLKYAVNIWHVSPLEFAELYARMGRESYDRHYNIAYWLWELEDFPDEWTGYDSLLDEIWTPSEFISRALRKKVRIPVYTLPYHVSAQTDPVRFNRANFGLPEDEFLFLMMYDGKSVSDRKNPDDVIRAYRMAFAVMPQKPTRTPGLVIKAGSLTEKEQAKLQAKLVGCPNTHILTGSFPKTEVNSLIACVDVLVSLHRAEGFGLVMAEAMQNGVPVIATGWSANTEFMNAKTACMVPYRLITLNRDIPPYRKGNRWAQPSTKAAAVYMRRLLEDESYREKKAERGQKYVRSQLGRERIARLFRERLEAIRMQMEA